MNTRIEDRGTPTHLQDPNFTRSVTPPVEKPLTPTEARQGSKGKPVFAVLVAGLILAMIAWGAAEWYGQSTEPPAEQTASPPAAPATAAPNPNAAPSSNP